MNKLELCFKLILSITWVLVSALGVRAQSGTLLLLVLLSNFPTTKQLNGELQFVLPPLPDDVGSSNHRTEGGSRGCIDNNTPEIPSSTKKLTALAPSYKAVFGLTTAEHVFGLTTAEHPTFWFYVPYQPPFTGNFVLEDKSGTLISETKFTLPTTPGIVSISLPDTKPALEVGTQYHWYFKVYCNSQTLETFTDGLITRKSLEPDLKSQLEKVTPTERVFLYAKKGFWYDALTTEAKIHRTQTQDPNWAALLRSVDLEAFASEPILECCQAEN